MSTNQSERLRGLLEPLVAASQLDLEEIEVSRVEAAAGYCGSSSTRTTASNSTPAPN